MDESKFREQLLAEAAQVIARSKSRMKRRGFSKDDIDDLGQDVVLRILERDRIYDPERSPTAAFVQMIADQAIANSVEHRSAKKRGGGIRPLSLDAPLTNDDDTTTGENCVGRADDPFEGAAVTEFVTMLPGDLRRVAELLCAGKSQSEIARTLDLHRTTVAVRVGELRERLSSWLDF